MAFRRRMNGMGTIAAGTFMIFTGGGYALNNEIEPAEAVFSLELSNAITVDIDAETAASGAAVLGGIVLIGYGLGYKEGENEIKKWLDR